MTVVVLLLYSAFYAHFNIISKIIYIAFPLGQLSIIVYFSHTIGMIDVKAKEANEKLYYVFGVKANCPDVKSFKNEVRRNSLRFMVP